MDKLEFYNKYRSVPSNALRAFDNGNFKGTDINTMWRIKSLTETFGAVGQGWYFEIVRLWTEKSENTNEAIVFAQIRLFVKWDGEWSKPIEAVGGNKLETYVKSKDYYKLSDEAYKMAITDAFGVACKYLGMGADVYWDNDKTKYTNSETDDLATPSKMPQKATIVPREKKSVKVAENSRRLNIRTQQEITGCPNSEIVNFMNAVGKDNYDDLTEIEFSDLLKMVKVWKS